MKLQSLLIGFALLATNVCTMSIVAQNKAEVAEKNYGVSVENSPQNARCACSVDKIHLRNP